MSIAVPVGSERSGPQSPDGTGAHLTRNFRLGVTSGVAYNLYTAVLSTQLVMTWFLSELTDSNLLISLLVPIELGSWYLLQMLLSGYVRQRSRSLPLYRAMGVIRVAALALLSLAMLVIDRSAALLVVFLALFTANSVAAGVAALPFLSVVAKTIPVTKRGMYFGWRRFAGGLLGLLGAALIKIILSPDFGLGFPSNYALVFLVGCLTTAVLVGTFSLTVEPRGAVDRRAGRPPAQLRAALLLAARDRTYAGYLGLRAAIAVANYAWPFYAIYARRALNVSGAKLGTYLMASTLASVLSNLILGRIGDRYGNRLLVRLAALSAVLPSAMALFLIHVSGLPLDRSGLFTLVFVLQGLHATAHSIGSNNYLLELAPPPERITYISFAHGIVGLTVLASPLGGALVDWMGFEPLFWLALAGGVVALILSLGLTEPRKNWAAAG